jgi:hypothetical protein
VLLVLVVLLSLGSGFYAGASFFPQQAPNLTITTTIFTTTTSLTTSTIWSTVTSVVYGVWTTVQYTTSTSTVTLTSVPVYNYGDTNIEASGSTGSYGVIYIRDKFVLSSPFTMTSIWMYHGSTGSGHARFGIYQDNGAGYPGTLVLDTGSFNANQGTGWVQTRVTATVLPAGTYWIAFITDVAQSSDYIRYASGGSGYLYTQAYGALPNPFPSSTLPSGYTWSLYVQGS